MRLRGASLSSALPSAPVGSFSECRGKDAPSLCIGIPGGQTRRGGIGCMASWSKGDFVLPDGGTVSAQMKKFLRVASVALLVGIAVLCGQVRASEAKGYVAISRSSVSAPAGDRVIVGKVTRVSDGDTIHVTDGLNVKHKIRMLGIDAPESSQKFGAESTQHLASLIANQFVKVAYSERDQYGRVLGTVWLGDTNVNLSMVESGHAWAYHYNKDPQYAEAQSRAKRAGRGLWINPDAQDPWSYRKDAKSFPVPQRVEVSPVDAKGRGGLPPAAQRKEYRAGGKLPVSSRIPAPVCDDWPDTGFWLSTNSNARHNRNCENYRKTRGYPCTKDEGRPCGKCGG